MSRVGQEPSGENAMLWWSSIMIVMPGTHNSVVMRCIGAVLVLALGVVSAGCDGDDDVTTCPVCMWPALSSAPHLPQSACQINCVCQDSSAVWASHMRCFLTCRSPVTVSL